MAINLLPVGRARVAAALIYKNDIISFGINSYKSSPFQKRFGRNEDAIFLHAETSAIRNALRMISLDEIAKSTLYICRMKYNNQYKEKFVFGLSRPCIGCQKAIAEFRIKKVLYTKDEMGYDVL
jgi:deoxycytidylate deaminase